MQGTEWLARNISLCPGSSSHSLRLYKGADMGLQTVSLLVLVIQAGLVIARC